MIDYSNYIRHEADGSMRADNYLWYSSVKYGKYIRLQGKEHICEPQTGPQFMARTAEMTKQLQMNKNRHLQEPHSKSRAGPSNRSTIRYDRIR
jgi:hypothetical protein